MLSDDAVRKFFPETQQTGNVSSGGAAVVNGIDKKEAIFWSVVNVQGYSYPDQLVRGKPVTLDEKEKYQLKRVEFNIKGRYQSYPVLGFIPMDSSGKPLPSASDVVFFAQYMGQNNLYSEKVTPNLDGEILKILKLFASHYGMTIYTLKFEADVEDVEDTTKCYYYRESGSHVAILAARDKIVADHGLEKRKLYVYGVSGGGSLAQLLAMTYPDEMAAVAMTGGHRYEEVENSLPFSWLVLNTRGDFRDGRNKMLTQQGREYGANMVYGVTDVVGEKKTEFTNRDEGFHHTPSETTLELCQQFLVGVRDQYRATGQYDDFPKWPYRYENADPFTILPNTPHAPDAEGKPEGFTYLPSKEFADLWLTMRYRDYQIPILDGGKPLDETLPVHVSIPPVKTPPKGVLILDLGGEMDAPNMGDLADFLTVSGYIVVTADFSDDLVYQIQETTSLYHWLMAQKAIEELPVSIFGAGIGGARMTIAATINPKRVGNSVVYKTPMNLPWQQLSMIRNAPKMQFPVEILKNSKEGSKDRYNNKEFLWSFKFGNHPVSTTTFKPSNANMHYFDAGEAAMKAIAKQEEKMARDLAKASGLAGQSEKPIEAPNLSLEKFDEQAKKTNPFEAPKVEVKKSENPFEAPKVEVKKAANPFEAPKVTIQKFDNKSKPEPSPKPTATPKPKK